jgi:hypothetical protein
MVPLVLTNIPGRIPHKLLFFFTEVGRCPRVALYSRCSFQPLKRLPDPLLFQHLPDFSLLPLLSHDTTGSIHEEGAGSDCNAPSEERPIEPQTPRGREQVDEQQQDVDACFSCSHPSLILFSSAGNISDMPSIADVNHLKERHD